MLLFSLVCAFLFLQFLIVSFSNYVRIYCTALQNEKRCQECGPVSLQSYVCVSKIYPFCEQFSKVSRTLAPIVFDANLWKSCFQSQIEHWGPAQLEWQPCYQATKQDELPHRIQVSMKEDSYSSTVTALSTSE